MFGAMADLMRGLPAKPWAIIEQAQEFYHVKEITTANQLLENAPDLLAIIHPSDLDEPMLYAIDQYLLAGVNTALFYDGFFESKAMQ